mmetsp:Transcript_39773/g.88402  ORF Transcript_39773/g.88402 Transcript_39773/m.88402 type:complete len:204 (-) Transcript_39773:629-1240(-)
MLATCSRTCRLKRKREDPKTPDVNSNCSKRCFDGLVRVWRKALHKYDPSAELEKEPMEFAVGAAANATTTSNTVDCGDTCGQGAAGKKRVFGDAFQWVQSAQRSPKKPSDSVQGGSGGPGSHIDADQQSLSSAACEERRRMPAGGPQTVLDLLLDDRSNESWGVAGYGTVPVAAPTSVPAVSKPLHTGSWADDVEDDDVDVQL